jgi:DnaJ-class molecular chaperone
MPRNHYHIPGVSCETTREEIKAAFRRRARELRPDRNGMPAGPFLELREACAVLVDPLRHGNYDREIVELERQSFHTRSSGPFARSRPAA